MKIAIMQPYLLPYLGYFQLINCVDTFIFFDDVQYIRRGWINRNRFYTNTISTFTLPLKKSNLSTPICHVQLADNYPQWKEKFLQTITHHYKKAPYFEPTITILSRIIHTSNNSFVNLVKSSLTELCQHLDIKTNIVDSSQIYDNQHLKGEQRIIDICQSEKATLYINPQGGRELYNYMTFNKYNLLLKFLYPQLEPYQHFHKKIAHNLSIIDVLMFNSTTEIKSQLQQYYLTP